MRSCASYVMRSLTWALNVAHSHRLSTLSLCLESLRNRTPSNLKLHHISKHPSKKMFLAGRWFQLANGVLCFSTPKHNGKSGTVFMKFYFNQSNGFRVLEMIKMWNVKGWQHTETCMLLRSYPCYHGNCTLLRVSSYVNYIQYRNMFVSKDVPTNSCQIFTVST
jgi:hypothetical protein